MVGGVVGIGGYKALLGDRFGITKDDRLVVGGQVFGMPYDFGAGVPYFCDPANGDNNLSGRTPGTAVASLVTALGLTTAAQNDVVVLIGDGGTGGTARLTAELDWAKNAVHLVSITAPVMEAQRARISHASSPPASNFQLFKVSANGCILSGFSFFQGVGEAATDEKLFELTGERNYFENIAFAGLGAQVGADRAGSQLVYINGGGENTFRGCTIGLETVQRNAANANVKIRSGAQRNQFIDCDLVMAADATGALFVDANAANALNGSTMVFKRCFFRNLLNITGAVDPAVVVTYSATVNGTIYFIDCVANATKWAAAGATVQIGSTSGATIDGFDSGMTGDAADS